MRTDSDDLLLHHLFERQARRTPQAIALVDRESRYTYGELDELSNRLAVRLRALGLGPEEVAGVYMERCAEYVIACLAALKAGGAFLPLELAYPPALLDDVLADSEPRVLLSRGRRAERLPGDRIILRLDEGWEAALGEEAGGERAEPDPENLAFVSYSSGTTGKPKGIANPHRAAVRSYLWRFSVSDYRPGDRVGCNVFFVWEMLRPLLRGATTVVIPDDEIYDPEALVRFLAEHRITETLITPSLLESLLDAHGSALGSRVGSLKTLWLNGEVVTKNLARRALAALPGTRLLNVYSVSETHEVAAGDLRELVESEAATHCPVGPPMDPHRTYVLDEDGAPVPEGEAGELHVGGGCLARGYVNLPEKTAERFLEDPFAPEDGARMYRTGDKARLLPGGSLEILGRVDFMVKIRGYSVELGAVEAAIGESLAVRSCVAVADGGEGEDKRLVAYLVPDPERRDGRYARWEIDPRTGRSPKLRRLLQERLPHYMIPAVFVELGSLPIQETTGKVDRSRLPDPPPRSGAHRETPRRLSPDASRAEKEAALARTWEAILGLENGDVRSEDDFFEVGGHSLAAAEMLSRVEGIFGVRVPVGVFLEEPTVAGLCDEVETMRKHGESRRISGPDLCSEAALEAGISPQGEPEAPALRDARRILLTGATGFVGAFLLEELLSGTDAEILCLVRPRKGQDGLLNPVRENLSRYGLWKPETAHRIAPVSGDLGEPMFGLSQEEFDRLAREVDMVFHAGAVVNLIYPYRALKPVNVDGTREVLRLACRHRSKPVHHVSTNGIFPSDGRLCCEDDDLDSLADAREDGYGQSKWVAERLVRDAGERGLPVCVYRPGNVSGHSETGASNPKDTLTTVLRESLRIGKAPEIGGWRL
ncbi:MAG: non-ribosomal peptide synthetase, partial [Actinomycetota bacterium]